MEAADFSGWATKAGLKCSDGRTIMHGAFRDQDKAKVPLVWQHGHGKAENILGHAILESRDEGIYAYGFFNETDSAKHARQLLEHGDINALSIWANELVERAGKVLHGAIREVSLVLSGANPGAVIESVRISHGDGSYEEAEDEAVIYTGEELVIEHGEEKTDEDIEHADGDKPAETDDGETLQDIYEAMSDDQKEVVHYMIGQAIAQNVGVSDGEARQDDMGESDETLSHDDLGDAEDGETKEDKVGDADDTIQHSNNGTTDTKGTAMTNVFEKDAEDKAKADNPDKYVLSHSEVQGIMASAMKSSTIKEAVQDFALSHGIDDIDILFPEATALEGTPEWNKRRTEWVAGVLSGCRKTPFSRIKTRSADLTEDEARAKGYITGSLKKEEFFAVSKRVTTPTTIYKKQKLDRDDMIDITDFDVVMWLKGEMRVMLDEELARAILIGDGRDVAAEDKINEGNIRPIATDHQLYVTTVNVNLDDANSSYQEIIDAMIRNRKYYKGTGTPVLYTTETVIAEFMLLKDGVNRRIYRNLDELAAELRVSSIVPVEVMEEEADIIGIMVNLQDYVIGADRGGQVAMFDDFDIDYNQYKYLIETRVSGALAKLKAAMVFRKVAATDVAVVPAAPTFDGTDVTIVDTTNVKYYDAADDSQVTAVGGPYTLAAGQAMEIYAVADAGYYFAVDANTRWTFRNRG